MKLKLFKALILLIAFPFIIVSCTNSEAVNDEEKNAVNSAKSSSSSTIVIPELLERSAIMGSEKEEQLYKKKYNQFSSVIKKKPNNYDAYLSLAELYIAEARITGEHPYYYPAALKMTDHVLDQNPESKEILFRALSLKSSVHLSLHQFKEGLQVAERAVELNPYNANIYGALVDGNVELGNYEEAVNMADQMVSIRPDLRSYSRVSYLREIYGDVEGSKNAMNMAVKAGYPGYESTAWARYTLGKINENYGDLDNAEMHYKIVLKERPNYAFAINGLAGLEIKKGNLKKAEELVDQAISIMPEISFYETLANIYLLTGRKDEAKKVANKIIDMMAEDEASGHTMDLDKAKVYMHYLQDNKEALTLAKKEYSARPKNIDVNLLMAKIYIEQENYSKAEKHVKIASETNSKKPDLLLCKGIIESKKGNQTQAKSLYEEALKADPYLSGDMADNARKSI